MNWFGLQDGHESCICEKNFYGPNCEFKDVVGSDYEESQLKEMKVSRSKRNTKNQESRLNKHVKRSRRSRQMRMNA